MLYVPTNEQELTLRLDMIEGAYKINEEVITSSWGEKIIPDLFLIGYSFWKGKISLTTRDWIKIVTVPLTPHYGINEHSAYSIFLHGDAAFNFTSFVQTYLHYPYIIKTYFVPKNLGNEFMIQSACFQLKKEENTYIKNLTRFYLEELKTESIKDKVSRVLKYNSGFQIRRVKKIEIPHR
jgi:hypothetical protein